MKARIRSLAIVGLALVGAAGLCRLWRLVVRLRRRRRPGRGRACGGGDDHPPGARRQPRRPIRPDRHDRRPARQGRPALRRDRSRSPSSGRYSLPDGATVPDFDFDVGLTMKDQALGGALVLKDGKAYVKLGNVGYQIPAAITRVLTAPAADAEQRDHEDRRDVPHQPAELAARRARHGHDVRCGRERPGDPGGDPPAAGVPRPRALRALHVAAARDAGARPADRAHARRCRPHSCAPSRRPRGRSGWARATTCCARRTSRARASSPRATAGCCWARPAPRSRRTSGSPTSAPRSRSAHRSSSSPTARCS